VYRLRIESPLTVGQARAATGRYVRTRYRVANAAIGCRATAPLVVRCKVAFRKRTSRYAGTVVVNAYNGQPSLRADIKRR
jgi:hypothetical protein